MPEDKHIFNTKIIVISSVGSDLRSFDLRSRFKIIWVILDL